MCSLVCLPSFPKCSQSMALSTFCMLISKLFLISSPRLSSELHASAHVRLPLACLTDRSHVGCLGFFPLQPFLLPGFPSLQMASPASTQAPSGEKVEFSLIPAVLSIPHLSNLSVPPPKSILNPPISLFSTRIWAAIISCTVHNNNFLILLARSQSVLHTVVKEIWLKFVYVLQKVELKVEMANFSLRLCHRHTWLWMLFCLFFKIERFSNINVKRSIADQPYLISWNGGNRKYCQCILDLSPAGWLETTSCVWRSVLSEVQGKTTTENNLQTPCLFSKIAYKIFSCSPADLLLGVYVSWTIGTTSYTNVTLVLQN